MKETAPSPMPNPALQATLRIKPHKAPELERWVDKEEGDGGTRVGGRY